MAPLLDVAASSTEQQWYYSHQELQQSPSIAAGLRPSDERKARQDAIKFVWKLKDGLGVRQSVVTTAATFIHRFYMRESVQTWDVLLLAGAATFLACKNEEEPRSIKLLVQLLMDIRRNPTGRIEAKGHHIDRNNPAFDPLRSKLVACEEALLRVLCFDLTVRDPHWIALKAVKKSWANEPERADKVGRVGWSFLNDSLAAPLCLLYRPHLLAAAAILLACAQLNLPLPERPPSLEMQKTIFYTENEAEEGEEPPSFEPEVWWLELLDVKPEELRNPVLDLVGEYKFAEDEFVVEQGAKLANLVQPLLASFHQTQATAAVPPATSAAVDPSA
ncbi:hypothetical protein JCM11641_000666 [Rhodosporidiobolus odoratus]